LSNKLVIIYYKDIVRNKYLFNQEPMIYILIEMLLVLHWNTISLRYNICNNLSEVTYIISSDIYYIKWHILYQVRYIISTEIYYINWDILYPSEIYYIEKYILHRERYIILNDIYNVIYQLTHNISTEAYYPKKDIFYWMIYIMWYIN
jgi:hypothetical protein